MSKNFVSRAVRRFQKSDSDCSTTQRNEMTSVSKSNAFIDSSSFANFHSANRAEQQ